MTRVVRRWPIAASSLTAVVLAACGTAERDRATSSRGSDRNVPATMRQFADCMRDQGVDVPKPSGDGPPSRPPFDPTDEKVRKALEACAKYMPQGGPPGDTPPNQD